MDETSLVNRCGCELCRLEVSCLEVEQHRLINLLIQQMDEHLRRWFAGYLAVHYDSVPFVSIITGISEKTIRRGMEELENEGRMVPQDRIRFPGAGRPRGSALGKL